MTETTRLRSYGRRKARPLSERKDRLLNELLPALRLPLAKPAPSKLTGLFAQPVTDVWLEIGFGSGEHLFWQAEHHPDVGFIGCEPFINGVAVALGHIRDQNLANVRLWKNDALDVLRRVPDGALSFLYLLHPDPWPKARHAKRRMVNDGPVDLFAAKLKPGGELRFASDNGDYAGESLLTILADGAFVWTAECAKDWRERPSDWPETRYERKALSEGRKPVYLSWCRL